MNRSGRPVHINSNAILYGGETTADGDLAGTSLVNDAKRFFNELVGCVVEITAGPLSGETSTITGYNNSTKEIFVAVAFTGQVTLGTAYVIKTPLATEVPRLWNIPRRSTRPDITTLISGETIQHHTGGRTSYITIRNTGTEILHVSFDNGRNYFSLPSGTAFDSEVSIHGFHTKTDAGKTTNFEAIAVLV